MPKCCHVWYLSPWLWYCWQRRPHRSGAGHQCHYLLCLGSRSIALIEGGDQEGSQSWSENQPDCCSWNGVTCDGITGRVVSLDLHTSSLKGRISSSLASLSSLQLLRLTGNTFTGHLPTTTMFRQLPKIGKMGTTRQTRGVTALCSIWWWFGGYPKTYPDQFLINHTKECMCKFPWLKYLEMKVWCAPPWLTFVISYGWKHVNGNTIIAN